MRKKKCVTFIEERTVLATLMEMKNISACKDGLNFKH